MIETELAAKAAPPMVLDAGKRIDNYVAAGLRPPSDLVAYVRQWVGNSNQQDRYGK